MPKLTPAERLRLAKWKPPATAPGPVLGLPAHEADEWPHLTCYATVEELRSAMGDHTARDFARVPQLGVCDYCSVEGLESPHFAAWLCRRCGLAMCRAHHDFLILETDENFDGGLAQ